MLLDTLNSIPNSFYGYSNLMPKSVAFCNLHCHRVPPHIHRYFVKKRHFLASYTHQPRTQIKALDQIISVKLSKRTIFY